MAFSSYDALQNVITVDGVAITGLAEKHWDWQKKEAKRELTVGGQGDVISNEINDPIYEATVTVQATSPQANFLFSLEDRKEPFPIWCTNKALGRTEGGSKALVTEVPADSREKTAGDLEFKFSVIDGKTITE